MKYLLENLRETKAADLQAISAEISNSISINRRGTEQRLHFWRQMCNMTKKKPHVFKIG